MFLKVGTPSLRVFLFILAGSFACSFPGSINAQSTVLAPAEINSRLDAYIAPYLEQKDFSGVVLIAGKNEVLAQKTYGLANVRTGAKNQINTRFRIASLSKSFTAAAIVMLMERGLVNLDDPLSKWFSQFPNGQHITVDQLLRHTSGVGTLDAPKDYRSCYTGQQLVTEIGKLKPQFPPGTDDSYSNEGYNLLAAIIEKVSGASYEHFLRKNIFEPLKMNDSGSLCSESKMPRAARGYTTGATAKSIEELPFSEFAQIGAGSLYSTAPDLHKWLTAVSENQLFRLDKLRYPYGWGKREYGGRKLIEQSGLVEGFNSYMALYPQEKVYVIFLSNIQSGLFNRVPQDLKAVAFGGEFSRPFQLSQTRAVNVKDINEYIGVYQKPGEPVPLKVVLKNGNLYLRWGNYPFIRSLTPIAKDNFFHRAEYANISFERNQAGRIEKIKWQSGTDDPFFLNKVSTK